MKVLMYPGTITRSCATILLLIICCKYCHLYVKGTLSYSNINNKSMFLNHHTACDILAKISCDGTESMTVKRKKIKVCE